MSDDPNDFSKVPPMETWQRTPEIRWVPQDGGHNPRYTLEQAWRNPDGRLEWRVVPKTVYGGAPDAGR